MTADALSLYDYKLPPACIAQRPLAERDASRLLLLRGRDAPAHHAFRDLPDLLEPGDLLVRNDTRVIPARLFGRRATGGKTEFLLVRRLDNDDRSERWLCLARPASHLKVGQSVTFGAGELTATIAKKLGAGQVEAMFAAPAGEAVGVHLRRLGQVPLPPYIDRRESGPDALDAERYQTTYAQHDGAVAAPTAGLHFTPRIDARLAQRGVGIATLTLHVGPGTFRPIKTADLAAHEMDPEFYRISPLTAAAVNAVAPEDRRVLAVGSTTTRALEAAASAAGRVRAGADWTDLFIRPGHGFRVISGLLTNFHLPRSTLLALVAALAGRERILAAYAEAVREGYRFYSYGDAMLILP